MTGSRIAVALACMGVCAAEARADDDEPSARVRAELVAPAAGGTPIAAAEAGGFEFLAMRLGLERSFFSLEVPLLLSAPSTAGDSEVLGGFVTRATANLSKTDNLKLLFWGAFGFTRPQYLSRSFYGLPPGSYLGDLAPAFQVGFDEIGDFRSGGVAFTIDFVIENDLAGETSVTGGADIGFWRKLSDNTRLGARLEGRAGADFTFDNDRGAQVGLHGDLSIQLSDAAVLAVRLGLANLAPPDPRSAGDTLYLGLDWQYAIGRQGRKSSGGGDAVVSDALLVRADKRYGISSRLSFPAGPVATGATEAFEWVGFDLALRRKWLSISMPMVFHSPLFSEPSVGAVIATATRHLTAIGGMAIRGSLRAGAGRPGAFAVSDYGLIDYTGNFHGGGGVALEGVVGLDDRDRVLLSVGAGLGVQLEAADNAEMPEDPDTHVAVQIPLGLSYTAGARTRIGVDSGFFSGPGVELDSNLGLEVPAVLRIQRLIGGVNSVSVGAGLSNVAPPDGQDVGDSLFIGLGFSSVM